MRLETALVCEVDSDTVVAGIRMKAGKYALELEFRAH
jgi:hypothetical protein